MVVTSNADWDEAHPAGTSLDDVLQVRINSSSDFVHDGYDMGEYKYEFLQNYDYLKTIEKRPSELTAADMKMVYYSLTDFSSQTKIPCNRLHQCPDARKRAYADASLDDRRGRCQDRLDNLHAGGRSCVAIAGSTNSGNCKIADPQWIGYLSCRIRTLFLPGFGTTF